MVDRQAVRLAVGVGCRAGCPAREIADLVRDSLGSVSGVVIGLYSAMRKRDEPGLRDAAERLGLRLVFIPDAELETQPATPSDLVLRATGLPSIAEAAALAAFGGRARLVLAKRRSAAATCAIAEEIQP